MTRSGFYACAFAWERTYLWQFPIILAQDSGRDPWQRVYLRLHVLSRVMYSSLICTCEVLRREMRYNNIPESWRSVHIIIYSFLSFSVCTHTKVRCQLVRRSPPETYHLPPSKTTRSWRVGIVSQHESDDLILQKNCLKVRFLSTNSQSLYPQLSWRCLVSA